MKSLKVVLVIMAAALITLGLSGMSYGFHAGGVAHCDGCHTMHNSADNPAQGATTSTLLKGSDASSTCLNCHNGAGGYHINSSDGSNVNQGGDFYWVNNEYTLVVRNNLVHIAGIKAGHNLRAADYTDFIPDTNPSNAQAPGGTYYANVMGCTSCHDAHGQVSGGGTGAIVASGSYGCDSTALPAGEICGNYRILGDSAYAAGGADDGYAFSADAPVARANSSTGTAVAYGSSMSEWCGNCHGQFVVDASLVAHKHPASNNANLNGYGSTYDLYVKTGDMSGTLGYDPFVPIELGETNGALLNATDRYDGGYSGATSNVACITCHRAHGSPFNNAGRWDFETEFIVESDAYASPDVPATAAIYYADGVVYNQTDLAARYGHYQRSLCNKCHTKD